MLRFSGGSGKSGRMNTGESVLDLKSVPFPGVSDWLSKYWIKLGDKNTILIYPKNGNLTLSQNNVAQDLNPLPEETDIINKDLSDNSVNQEDENITDDNKGDIIANKHLRVLKLKKLLEQRLKGSLSKNKS